MATTLEFSLGGNQSVRIDGKKLATGEPYRITEKTPLELEGFGRLDVTPGGEDVRTRRAGVEELQHSLNAALVQRQYRSVGEAEAAFREKNGKLGEIDNAKARLAGVAPAGLEQLRSAVADRREELAASTSDPATPPISIEEAKRVAAEAESEEAEAKTGQSAAEREWRGRLETLSAIREKWTEVRSAIRHHAESAKRLAAELEDKRRTRSDAGRAARPAPPPRGRAVSGPGAVLRASDRKSLTWTIEQGVKQTLGYMKKCGAEEGHLVVIDRRAGAEERGRSDGVEDRRSGEGAADGSGRRQDGRGVVAWTLQGLCDIGPRQRAAAERSARASALDNWSEGFHQPYKAA